MSRCRRRNVRDLLRRASSTKADRPDRLRRRMKLGLIGAGNMASALARGIGEPVLVADIDAAKARALAEELGGEAVASNAELAERADAVVLCHKPKQLEEVAAEASGRARVVISILAATTTDRLE